MLRKGDDATRKTDEVIRAEQRVFNVQGVNDLLLAIFYAEHHEHLREALAAAPSDISKRGNKIYADDTMAWVLASIGRCDEARTYAERASRYGTDPKLQYHVGVAAWRRISRASLRESTKMTHDAPSLNFHDLSSKTTPHPMPASHFGSPPSDVVP